MTLRDHHPDGLSRLQAAFRDEARATDRDMRRALAANYKRSAVAFSFYLPDDLAAEAMASDDPEVTWRVIRHFCRKLRAYRRDKFWAPLKIGYGTIRQLVTCELHLWRRQKDAEATRRSVQYQRDMERALFEAAE